MIVKHKLKDAQISGNLLMRVKSSILGMPKFNNRFNGSTEAYPSIWSSLHMNMSSSNQASGAHPMSEMSPAPCNK